MLKKLFFVLVAVWMALVPLSYAFASPENPSIEIVEGPDGAKYILGKTEEITQDSGDAVSGCKTFTKGVTMSDIFGNLLWKYSWKINWCYNGTTITYKNRWRVVGIYGVGLQFMGDVANNTAGGVGQTYFTGYAQGRICQVVISNTCFNQWYPWVEQAVYGNGSYEGDAGW